jgi:hypothetical protein
MIIFILTILGPLLALVRNQVDFGADYRTASRESVNLAPKPEEINEAVIQVYAARAFSWRGVIASHCWISVKQENAADYTVYQVVGWRQFYNLPVLEIKKDLPDRSWFDQTPKIIFDIRGQKAQDLIAKIDEAAQSYSYKDNYTIWPGPNSNTFIAYIARQVPDFGLALPANAIGKDYISNKQFFAVAPSNSGYQFSLFGLLGITIAKKEGIEVNFLGLVYGIKFVPFQIILPGWF